jgi:hypothetical protein
VFSVKRIGTEVPRLIVLLTLLADASGLRSQAQSDRNHDTSRQNKKRLERFEKQVSVQLLEHDLLTAF